MLRGAVKLALGAAAGVDRMIDAVTPRRGGAALPPEPESVRSVLVWSLDRLGDLVRTTPAIRALRVRFPQANITLVGAGRAAAALLENPHINELHQVDSPYRLADHRKVFARLKGRVWDLGLVMEADAHWTRLGAWWMRGLGVRTWVCFDFGAGVPRGGLGVTRTDVGSWIDQFNRLAAAVGAVTDDLRTEVFVSAAERAWAERFLRGEGVDPARPFFVLHPGGNFLKVSRQWPAERFAELATLLSRRWPHPILITGIASERPVAERIAAGTEASIVNLCGKLNLRQLTAVLDRSAVCVMNDTGPTHIAHALGRKVVLVLGPTAPSVVGVPAGSVVARVDLPCSPCAYFAGWRACVNEVQWECLSKVSAELVLSGVARQLGERSDLVQLGRD